MNVTPANQRGFTLLEVLVAAAIMGIAVAGVLSGLASAGRNASRLTQYDRAVVLVKLAQPSVRALFGPGELGP